MRDTKGSGKGDADQLLKLPPHGSKLGSLSEESEKEASQPKC